MSELVVGIDLGTTNSALGYSQGAESNIAMFEIPQLIGSGDVQSLQTLPSFVYLARPGDFDGGALDLPWASGRALAVGAWARDRGAEVPAQVVNSAKSWLCYAGVDRKAPILPSITEDEDFKISPYTATFKYIEHLRDAWNHARPEQLLQKQKVLLTVPASFDEAAKELTAQAAASAGLEDVTLLEEPQAAFYAWLHSQGDTWRDVLKVNDCVLVVDVGGGTTDLSLIEAKDDGAGNLVLDRVAVGRHILLGGDNMDLALAHLLAGKLRSQGKKIDAAQQRSLVHQARRAKEQLLLNEDSPRAEITLLGRGSKLIGGQVRTELLREEVQQVVLDGFFPDCSKDDTPQRRAQGGFQEVGLPYEADAAITRHIAEFLANNPQTPTHVLFNGGVFNSQLLRAKLQEVLASWFGSPLAVLQEDDGNLAVAVGATAYGKAKETGGIRIRAGAAHSYYVGIEGNAPAVPGIPPPLKAVCVVPEGMEEGTSEALKGSELGLVVGEPVTFRLFKASGRRHDGMGSVLDEYTWPDVLEETTPITAKLEAEGMEPGDIVPVQLESHLTELGRLELWSTSGNKRWRLAFNVRPEAE